MGQPPAGPAINDPDLKKMTATVANPIGASPMQVFVIYSDADNDGGGFIRLWKDQSKTQQIGLTHTGNGVFQGSLPSFPTCDFYIEGIRPSKAANDVKVKVRYTSGMPGPGQPPPAPVEAEKTLAVTPIVSEFSVNPKDPATATFIADDEGRIYGISSGEQPNGGVQGATKPGVKYTADLTVSGIDGDAWFLQNVTDLSYGESAVTLRDGSRYDPSFGDATFPILDWVEPPAGAPMPFYPSIAGLVYDSNRKMIGSIDTPAIGSSTLFAGQLDEMDIIFQARMYLVWKYSDDTIYTLARADWQAVFQSTNLDHDPVLLASSVVSVSPMVRMNTDPAKIVGPTYNSIVEAAGFWVQV